MKTSVIIAGGPSLTRDQVEYAESKPVDIIGVNDAYKICGNLHILYACDKAWWHYHYGRMPELTCKKYSLEETGYPDVECLVNDGLSGISLEWPKIRTGGNSGYQAINLAILLGYKRIILIGYDMQQSGNKVHWFGDHPPSLNNSPPSRLSNWVTRFGELAALIPTDIEVINCTRETALTCFGRMNLEDVI